MNPLSSTLLEIEQGTPEWFSARLGRATASRFSDILSATKSGLESAARRNYRAELVIERLTGQPLESYSNSYMQWGSGTEDLARLAYELATGNRVTKSGFFQHNIFMAGASPDGLVDQDGLIEIKCKIPAQHIEALKLGQMPKQHQAQVQGQLFVTERQWCDFVSFDPRFPENAQLLISRVERDKEYIALLESELRKFLIEVEEECNFLSSYKR